MMLYHLHDFRRATLTPFRFAAEATKATFQNPLFPASQTKFGRAIAAGAELFERTTRHFVKPVFGLTTTSIFGETVQVDEEVVMTKPFCKLLHFNRHIGNSDPRVLIVAPMSGHHATLLRGTVESMLPDHDVYITDWVDARIVPLSQGKFDLDDYISYVIDFIRLLGPDVHVFAVCQPAPAVLCAISLLAQMDDPAQPRSMTLMGGPIDTRISETFVTEMAHKESVGWFEHSMVHPIPFYYPGAHRLVYPGFLQLQGFIWMNVDRHVGEHIKLFQHLVKGDGEIAEYRRWVAQFYSWPDDPADNGSRQKGRNGGAPDEPADWRGTPDTEGKVSTNG